MYQAKTLRACWERFELNRIVKEDICNIPGIAFEYKVKTAGNIETFAELNQNTS